jgi:hypothetical protein
MCHPVSRKKTAAPLCLFCVMDRHLNRIVAAFEGVILPTAAQNQPMCTPIACLALKAQVPLLMLASPLNATATL